MKVFAISDLHLSTNNPKPMDIFGPAWDNYLDKIELDWNKKVEEDDIVLLPGDFSWAMKLEDVKPDMEFLNKLKGKKVILKGNHDYWWSSISKLREILPNNVYAVQNDAIKFDNIIICGSRGWLPPEKFDRSSDLDEKIYRREVLRLEMSLKQMEKLREENDKVIAMLHFPPSNTRYQDSEVTELLERYNVNKVVYGHLHNYDKDLNLKYIKNGIEYYLTSCDLVDNKLTEIL